jgi:hypothetical protein
MHLHDLALRLARHRGIVLSAARTCTGWRLTTLRPSLPRAERVALIELGAHLGLAAAVAALVAAARPWATKTGNLRGGIAEDASVDWAALDVQNRAGESVELQKAGAP